MIECPPHARAEKTIVIGLGELHATKEADTVLVCLGIGSCIALCAYDTIAKVAGMAHLVLPSSLEGRNSASTAKFVDRGIPLLLGQMEGLGAMRTRIVAKMAGGANMLTAAGISNSLNIGERNIQAARTVLADLGLPLRADDTGGNRGRTVRLCVHSGRITVSTAGGSAYEL